MMEIKRDRYLKQLIESRQNGFIKVVTGIRRCGKSYLLNVLFYHYLLDNGVADDHIIRIDLEDRMNKELEIQTRCSIMFMTKSRTRSYTTSL